MIEYILSDLKSHVWFQFKINDTFKKLNNSKDKYYNTIKYDIHFRYEMYCLLENRPYSLEEFNRILNIATDELDLLGYRAYYATDKEQLIISKHD